MPWEAQRDRAPARTGGVENAPPAHGALASLQLKESLTLLGAVGRSGVLPPSGHGLLPVGTPVFHLGPLVVLDSFGRHAVEKGRGKDISKGVPQTAISTSGYLYKV